MYNCLSRLQASLVYAVVTFTYWSQNPVTSNFSTTRITTIENNLYSLADSPIQYAQKEHKCIYLCTHYNIWWQLNICLMTRWCYYSLQDTVPGWFLHKIRKSFNTFCMKVMQHFLSLWWEISPVIYVHSPPIPNKHCLLMHLASRIREYHEKQILKDLETVLTSTSKQFEGVKIKPFLVSLLAINSMSSDL